MAKTKYEVDLMFREEMDSMQYIRRRRLADAEAPMDAVAAVLQDCTREEARMFVSVTVVKRAAAEAHRRAMAPKPKEA